MTKIITCNFLSLFFTCVNYVAYIMSWHISMHVNVSTHAPFTPQGRVRPIGAHGYAALYAQRGKELRHFVRLLRVPLAIPQLTKWPVGTPAAIENA